MATVDIKIKNLKAADDTKATMAEVAGSIDATSIVQFQTIMDKLVEKGVKNLIIDCHNMKYINSTGLGTLLKYVDTFEGMDGHIVFVRIPSKVMLVMEMLGFNALFTIMDDEAAAFGLFGGGAAAAPAAPAAPAAAAPTLAPPPAPTAASSPTLIIPAQSIAPPADAAAAAPTFAPPPKPPSLTPAGGLPAVNAPAPTLTPSGPMTPVAPSVPAAPDATAPGPATAPTAPGPATAPGPVTAPATAATGLPKQTTCSTCKAILDVKMSGKYRCPRCETLFEAAADGSINFLASSAAKPVRVSVPAVPALADGLAKLTETLVATLPLNGITATDLGSAVAEASRSVMQQAYANNGTGLVHVIMSTDENSLKVDISDFGTAIPEATEGFENAKAVMDSVSVEPRPTGGNIVHMTKQVG